MLVVDFSVVVFIVQSVLIALHGGCEFYILRV